jgi:hypothetical protein
MKRELSSSTTTTTAAAAVVGGTEKIWNVYLSGTFLPMGLKTTPSNAHSIGVTCSLTIINRRNPHGLATRNC